jgi:hypothetical protein
VKPVAKKIEDEYEHEDDDEEVDILAVVIRFSYS